MRRQVRFVVAVCAVVGTGLGLARLAGVGGLSDAPESQVVAASIAEPQSSAPADGLRAVNNPLTGHDFTEAQVNRIDELRALFPDNSLIPTTDPAVLARRAAIRADQARVEPRIVAGVASDAEIRAFYQVQRDGVSDRIQLAQQVLAEAKWRPEVHDKYARILAFAQGQLERIDAREQASLRNRR